MPIDRDYIIRLRRELHRIPEIGYDLTKTLEVVRRELESLGIPYTEKFGKLCLDFYNEDEVNKILLDLFG